jgi:hypothetical protein
MLILLGARHVHFFFLVRQTIFPHRSLASSAIPISDQRLGVAAFLGIKDKMRKKLDPWKGKCLSSGGKLILTNTLSWTGLPVGQWAGVTSGPVGWLRGKQLAADKREEEREKKGSNRTRLTSSSTSVPLSRNLSHEP